MIKMSFYNSPVRRVTIEEPTSVARLKNAVKKWSSVNKMLKNSIVVQKHSMDLDTDDLDDLNLF